MITSMSNGVTALTAFQSALNVQSNNAANTKTMAFKSDTVSFSDMFYSNDQVGYGVSMDTPNKNFKQGSITPSNSQYDFALDGEGFFTVIDPANPNNAYYTRAGNFKNDRDNFLATNDGMQVMGLAPTVSGDIISSEYEKNIATSIVDDGTSTISINTYITDYVKAANLTGATGVSGTNYKTVDANISNIEDLSYAYRSALKLYATNPVEGEAAEKFSAKVDFPIIVTTNDEYTIELVVDGVKFQQNFEDSIENTLKLLSDKINESGSVTSSVTVNPSTGEMIIESMIPGKQMSVSQARLNNNLVNITELTTESGSGQMLVDAIYTELKTLVESVGGKVATNKSEIVNPLSGESLTFTPIVLDLNELGMNSTLYEKLLTGDPEAIAAYPGIESEDGNIYLSDGESKFLVGKLVPVTFTDKSQLKPEGDNLYTKSNQDMVPIYIEGNANVVGGYLEESNVDLSKELVNILTFQKAFEANSKSITTSDELLKTALALKNN